MEVDASGDAEDGMDAEGEEGTIEGEDAAMEEEEEEAEPCYVLSEEAIALFARSEERRRKERNQVLPS